MRYRLTIGVVRELRDRMGLDLLRIYEPATWERVRGDQVWQARAIAIAGGPADLVGDALDAHARALLDAVAEFFPEPREEKQKDEAEPDDDFDPWRELYQAAGVVGIDPAGISFRELLWMAEGAWRPMAALYTATINPHLDKAHRKSPDDINPYARRVVKIRRRYRATKKVLGV